MADSLDPGTPPADRPALERRRSKNPLRNMMQHLTVEGASTDDESGSPRRHESLMRRLSWRKSRSPSAHSEASFASSTRATVLRNADPALCATCTSFAADVDLTFAEIDESFTKAVNPAADDGFDKREHLVQRLSGLGEDRWTSTCPLCKLFWTVHVPGKGQSDYSLSGFSSRDTNYMMDCVKMFDMAHPARGKAAGLAPGFLGVVPSSHGRVSGNWFRNAGMLLRTMPEVMIERQPSQRGRSPAGRRTPEPPAFKLNDTSWLQQGIWGREIGQAADLGIARDWMRFCDEHHQGRCDRQLIQAEIPAFRLIDCSVSPPRIVDGSITATYAALSYVLGKAVITEPWPSVVQDAAIVARELGIRYLWVDQLCMQGISPADRAQQIERMDDIFEGATLTIIAAHGHDATQGLPGVGPTPRAAQPKYRFADSGIALVSSLQDPRLAIEASTWYTRGWTYQEGLLARRRLVFTKQQMYWECGGMVCPETLVMPLNLYHDARERRMADFVRPGLFNGVSYMDGSWESWKRLPAQGDAGVEGEASTLSIFRESDRHVVSYTKRRLTYDDDSLSAFLGISRRLERTMGKGKLGNLLGIPLWAPAEDETSAKPGPPRTKDIFALSTCFWHHMGSEVPRRRAHLPSWTWAGWEGAVELYSSIVVAGTEETNTAREPKKLLNHHYVSATQLTRNESSSLKWTYSPAMVVLAPDGSVAYDFTAASRPPIFRQGRYALRVSDPLVLDRVKARAHESGSWIFNDVSVDVRMSCGGRGTSGSNDHSRDHEAPSATRPSAIREYIERHARGEQMTVLWFVEDATVMLLVVQRSPPSSSSSSSSSSGDRRRRWERVGRARMAFPAEAKEVVRRFGQLEVMLHHLPLRRLGEDIIIE
ncbi:tol protein [Purpureocillium lavendulum]|uniref:Tol protein n=1 Tax=Purpureocillium lavendulum TaxID=1247861 RepID=A0AB34FZZ3_9HYPO|nr:tol protein [Purpureocillium lavendulum]